MLCGGCDQRIVNVEKLDLELCPSRSRRSERAVDVPPDADIHVATLYDAGHGATGWPFSFPPVHRFGLRYWLPVGNAVPDWMKRFWVVRSPERFG